MILSYGIINTMWIHTFDAATCFSFSKIWLQNIKWFQSVNWWHWYKFMFLMYLLCNWERHMKWMCLCSCNLGPNLVSTLICKFWRFYYSFINFYCWIWFPELITFLQIVLLSELDLLHWTISFSGNSK